MPKTKCAKGQSGNYKEKKAFVCRKCKATLNKKSKICKPTSNK